MDFPLISVIVPVYNVEKYLDRCIRSIVEQTYPNLEIILVDDGSPDGSGKICDAWAEKDSRIRVVHKENGGAGAARNTGLALATGEWFGFVDSDDYIAPQMYRHLYSLTNGEIDIAECAIVQTESDDLVLDDGSQGKSRVYTAQEAMQLHIRDELFCQTPPNKLYRSRVAKQIPFPVGTLIDDEYWTYQAIGGAGKLVHSSCRMYAYRQQDTSAMHRPFSVRRLDGLAAKLQRWNFLKETIPALAYEAQVDLLMSCLYGMQGSLQSLSGEPLEAAKTILYSTLAQIQPIPIDPSFPAKRRLLLIMAQKHLEPTARVLNFLIKIHLLT